MRWPTLREAAEAAPWVLSLALVAKLIFSWDKLPDEVASHFGLSGEPNGWMSREGFGAVTIAACVVMALLYSPVVGSGFEKVSLTFLFGVDVALLTVIIGFWQAINFNAEGKQLRPWWILAPLIAFLLILLFGGHWPGLLPGR